MDLFFQWRVDIGTQLLVLLIEMANQFEWSGGIHIIISPALFDWHCHRVDDVHKLSPAHNAHSSTLPYSTIMNNI